MEMIHCSNCDKITGFKRALGFGTFFAVLITAGVWIFVLPFYPKRCIVCGLTKGKTDLPWYRLWYFWVSLGIVVILPVLMILKGGDKKPPQTSATSQASDSQQNDHNSGVSMFQEVREHDTTQPQKSAGEPPVTISQDKITAYLRYIDLASEYDNNEVRADSLYKNKIILVKGLMRTVRNDDYGNSVLVFAKYNDMLGVECVWDRSNKDELVDLRPDMGVPVVGVCKGKMYETVYLNNCRLYRPPEEASKHDQQSPPQP